MADPQIPPHPPGPPTDGIQSRPRPVVETAIKSEVVPLRGGAPIVPPSKGKPPEKKPEGDFRDSVREILETVVFVVVLVLLLKTFLAEAFVIPTGSMAVTLLGYHKEVPCEQCGRPCLVNFSQEVDPQIPGEPEVVFGFVCENCYHPNFFQRFR
ncbi:MAG: hypothetical protein U0744_12810 [Gemmataceae bacterium]